MISRCMSGEVSARMEPLIEINKPMRCHFCKVKEIDVIKFGPLYKLGKVRAHYFCVLLSYGLNQNGDDHEGMLGFLLIDIRDKLRKTKTTMCVYCGKKNATIKCRRRKCQKIFHLPCGLKNGSLHQFMNEFKSFCGNHRPPQNIPKAILENAIENPTICCICYDQVEVTRGSKNALWAPCCRKTWYHRWCVQELAQSAGYFFKCAACNDIERFKARMELLGIFVPQQDASWERVPNAFAELLHRHDTCDAEVCRCPDGRRKDEENTVFEIILCRSCGAQGVHILCGGLKLNEANWECSVCQGVVSRRSELLPEAAREVKECLLKKAGKSYLGPVNEARPLPVESTSISIKAGTTSTEEGDVEVEIKEKEERLGEEVVDKRIILDGNEKGVGDELLLIAGEKEEESEEITEHEREELDESVLIIEVDEYSKEVTDEQERWEGEESVIIIEEQREEEEETEEVIEERANAKEHRKRRRSSEGAENLVPLKRRKVGMTCKEEEEEIEEDVAEEEEEIGKDVAEKGEEIEEDMAEGEEIEEDVAEKEEEIEENVAEEEEIEENVAEEEEIEENVAEEEEIEENVAEQEEEIEENVAEEEEIEENVAEEEEIEENVAEQEEEEEEEEEEEIEENVAEQEEEEEEEEIEEDVAEKGIEVDVAEGEEIGKDVAEKEIEVDVVEEKEIEVDVAEEKEIEVDVTENEVEEDEAVVDVESLCKECKDVATQTERTEGDSNEGRDLGEEEGEENSDGEDGEEEEPTTSEGADLQDVIKTMKPAPISHKMAVLRKLLGTSSPRHRTESLSVPSTFPNIGPGPLCYKIDMLRKVLEGKKLPARRKKRLKYSDIKPGPRSYKISIVRGAAGNMTRAELSKHLMSHRRRRTPPIRTPKMSIIGMEPSASTSAEHLAHLGVTSVVTDFEDISRANLGRLHEQPEVELEEWDGRVGGSGRRLLRSVAREMTRGEEGGRKDVGTQTNFRMKIWIMPARSRPLLKHLELQRQKRKGGPS